jgi:hypothetical protein
VCANDSFELFTNYVHFSLSLLRGRRGKKVFSFNSFPSPHSL